MQTLHCLYFYSNVTWVSSEHRIVNPVNPPYSACAPYVHVITRNEEKSTGNYHILAKYLYVFIYTECIIVFSQLDSCKHSIMQVIVHNTCCVFYNYAIFSFQKNWVHVRICMYAFWQFLLNMETLRQNDLTRHLFHTFKKINI